jgi:broad specificity phosphatase PhoE
MGRWVGQLFAGLLIHLTLPLSDALLERRPGESPQQMSDRVDRVIAKVRKLHAEVSFCSLAVQGPSLFRPRRKVDLPMLLITPT